MGKDGTLALVLFQDSGGENKTGVISGSVNGIGILGPSDIAIPLTDPDDEDVLLVG